MEKDRLILNNGYEFEIESASSLSNIQIASQTKYDMISVWDMLTEENLKSVQIKNSDGLTIANYENLVLENETSKIQSDGTILTSFHLREKTEVELLREEVNALKEGQEINTGAIGDIGEVVSNLAEQGGLV